MEKFYKLIIAFVIGRKFFLSRRKSPYFSAILPVAFVIYMWGWLFEKVKETDIFSFYLLFIFGLVIFLGEWLEGRNAVNKRKAMN